jgi:hypothetical protein
VVHLHPLTGYRFLRHLRAVHDPGCIDPVELRLPPGADAPSRHRESGRRSETLIRRLTGPWCRSCPIPLIFDGTTTSGIQGTIEIGIRDNDVGTPSHALMGIGNVYIEPSTTPRATWFGLTTNASNISGSRVSIDHPYLNGKSAREPFHLSHQEPRRLPVRDSLEPSDRGLVRLGVTPLVEFATPTARRCRPG